MSEKDRNYYTRHRDEILAKRRADHRANGEEHRARQAVYRQKSRFVARAREQSRHAGLRTEALAAYGGRCACCGESEPTFLEIDHMRNDGATHRRAIGRGSKATYQWLKAKGWPTEGYQLLCANCNAGKARNGGICPHVKRRGSDQSCLDPSWFAPS